MGLEVFTIAARNPNEAVGGSGCLCHPNSKSTDCAGPYIVFHASEIAGEPNAGLHNSPHAVLSIACAKAAVAHAAAERPLEVGAHAHPEPPATEPTVEYDEAEHGHLKEVFTSGSLVKIGDHDYVRLPTDAVATKEVQVHDVRPDPVEGLPTSVAEKPQEEPGEQPGEWVEVPEV